MKNSKLFCLLFVSCFLIANSQQLKEDTEGFKKLSRITIQKSQLIKDLQQLGAEYVLEQGIFHSTKTVLPNGSWDLQRTLSVQAKEDGNVIYYKYAVLLECLSEHFVVRARYIISFNRKNFNTLTTWFIYTDVTGDEGDDFAVSDLPQFIDVALLKDPESGYQAYLKQGVDYTVKDAVANGQLPKGKYRAARVFSIKDTGFSFPYGYRFLVKLANDTNKKYYRALITVYVTENIPPEDQGDYPPEYVIYPNK
jgi:hypothetical protein